MEGATVECAVEHCGVRNFAEDAVELGPIEMKERLADSYSQEDVEVRCAKCERVFDLTVTSDLKGIQVDCPALDREAVFYRISREEVVDERDPEMIDPEENPWDGDPNPAWGVER